MGAFVFNFRTTDNQGSDNFCNFVVSKIEENTTILLVSSLVF